MFSTPPYSEPPGASGAAGPGPGAARHHQRPRGDAPAPRRVHERRPLLQCPAGPGAGCPKLQRHGLLGTKCSLPVGLWGGTQVEQTQTSYLFFGFLLLLLFFDFTQFFFISNGNWFRFSHFWLSYLSSFFKVFLVTKFQIEILIWFVQSANPNSFL